MKAAIRGGACAAAALLASLAGAPEANAQVLITGLSNVGFGNVGNGSSDLVSAQNVCVTSLQTNYRVTATGSGTSSAFTLASGSHRLAYDVRWAFTSGQTTGTLLQPGVSASGSSGIVISVTCLLGLGSSASLIVTLPAAAYNSATSGAYSGTLTLLIGPV